MATTKTIVIIGSTGSMGSTLARKLANEAQYRLLLMANNQAELDLISALEKSAPKAEVLATSCAKEGSWEADIIVIDADHDAEKAIAERIREVATGKVVMSIGPTSSKGTRPISHSSAAEQLQRSLRHTKVVRIFSTGIAFELPSLIREGGNDVFIAGNNGEAVETALAVMKSAGFNPVIVGDLSVSRNMEQMAAFAKPFSQKNHQRRAGHELHA